VAWDSGWTFTAVDKAARKDLETLGSLGVTVQDAVWGTVTNSSLKKSICGKLATKICEFPKECEWFIHVKIAFEGFFNKLLTRIWC
jgi:hypothetical protein